MSSKLRILVPVKRVIDYAVCTTSISHSWWHMTVVAIVHPAHDHLNLKFSHHAHFNHTILPCKLWLSHLLTIS